MRKKTDYEIGEFTKGDWYIERIGTSMYLFRDGKMRDWQKAIECYGPYYVNDETHFGSKFAANRALNRYLRGGKK